MEEETDFIEIHFPSRFISWILKDWIPYAMPYTSQHSNSNYSEIHVLQPKKSFYSILIQMNSYYTMILIYLLMINALNTLFNFSSKNVGRWIPL